MEPRRESRRADGLTAERVLDGLDATVAVVDEDGRIVMVNDAWARFAEENGGDPATSGRGASYFTCYDEDSSDGALANAAVEGMREVLSGAREAFDIEYPCHSPTKQRWFLMRATRIVSAGHPYLVVAHTDVTMRRLAEEAAWARARDVATVNARLQQLNDQLESFGYLISHDLRAPLRAIDVLVEEAREHVSGEGIPALEGVERQAARMRDRIEAMLEFAKSLEPALERVDVDLSKIAREQMDELRRREPTRRVEAVIEEGVHADADATLTRVVMQNLLENAWKFTRAKPSARVRFGEVEDAPGRFFVEDDGIGFDPSEEASLYAPFQRGAETGQPGAGVGLASVRRIVEHHGGRVWAEGRPGEGATFYFTLAP